MPLSWIRWTDRVIFTIGYLLFLYFVTFPRDIIGKPLSDDPMAPTGFAAVLGGVWIGYMLQGTFQRRLSRLIDNGAVQLGDGGTAYFARNFEALVRLCVPSVVLILCSVVIFTLTLVDSNQEAWPFLLAGGLMAAWLIGARFGYGIATGLAAFWLTRRREAFVVTPGHPDRAAGLRPLGMFYLLQAVTILLPAGFMIFWLAYCGLDAAKLQRAVDSRLPAGFSLVERNELQEIIEANSSHHWGYVRCLATRQTVLQNGLEDDPSDLIAIRAAPPGAIVGEYFCDPAWIAESPGTVFIWGWVFQLQLFVNLVVFILGWGVPHLLLSLAMRRARHEQVKPELRRISVQLKQMRDRVAAGEADALADRQAETELAARKAVLRSCPNAPVPLVSVFLTTIGHISAIAGLAAFFFGG